MQIFCRFYTNNVSFSTFYAQKWQYLPFGRGLKLQTLLRLFKNTLGRSGCFFQGDGSGVGGMYGVAVLGRACNFHALTGNHYVAANQHPLTSLIEARATLVYPEELGSVDSVGLVVTETGDGISYAGLSFVLEGIGADGKCCTARRSKQVQLGVGKHLDVADGLHNTRYTTVKSE